MSDRPSATNQQDDQPSDRYYFAPCDRCDSLRRVLRLEFQIRRPDGDTTDEGYRLLCLECRAEVLLPSPRRPSLNS